MHNQRFYIKVRPSMVFITTEHDQARMTHVTTGTEVTVKYSEVPGGKQSGEYLHKILMSRLLYALEEDWVCRIKRENPDCHMTHTVIPGM